MEKSTHDRLFSKSFAASTLAAALISPSCVSVYCRLLVHQLLLLNCIAFERERSENCNGFYKSHAAHKGLILLARTVMASSDVSVKEMHPATSWACMGVAGDR
jgi:hypothetical protein